MCTEFKKITALLLSVIIALSASVTVFAADSYADLESVTNVGSVDTGETDVGEEIVARASLFAATYFFPVAGHNWIYVENLSDEPITVGLYEVPVGQGVSVGAFSFSVGDGWGIYYNLEAYRENKDNNIDDCYSITIDLNKSELEHLSNSVRNYPNMWEMFIFNCTFFAFAIWNDNSPHFFIPFFLPGVAWIEMLIMGAKKGAVQMYYPTEDQIYRQKGIGNSARLESVGNYTMS